MPPAVSIIMPTYDRLHYLPPAIESVFAQSFQQWELIIADDGSNADTRAYLQSLDDPRAKVIWLAHTGRPAAVINAALREARGEYVAFLDSDDLWLPRKLEPQVASLRFHPRRKWSYTRFALVDRSGRPMASAGSAQWPAPSGWILEKLLQEPTVIAQPSVVVSRPLLEQLGTFDEQLIMCYDDELWFRLAAHSEIDGVEVVLTLVRRHGQHSGSESWHGVIAGAYSRKRCAPPAAVTWNRSCGGCARRCPRGLRAVRRNRRSSDQRCRHRIVERILLQWRFPQWWRGALRAIAPAVVRRAVRRYRARRQPTATPTGVIS